MTTQSLDTIRLRDRGNIGVVVLVIGDVLFAPINGLGRMAHPGFPASILASLGAGIGEEIAFRGLVLGLWGFLLNWLFKRFNGRNAALLIANVIAALAFGASHLGTVLVLTGATSLAELSPVLMAEILVLNGIIGLIAGQRYIRDGLVAAVGVLAWMARAAFGTTTFGIHVIPALAGAGLVANLPMQKG